MATKVTKATKKAARPARPAKNAALAAPAAPAPAERKAGFLQRWGMLIGLVLAAALLAQGAMVYLVSKKKDVVLAYEATIASRGEGKGLVQGCRHLAISAKGDIAYLYGINESSTLKLFARDGKELGVYSPSRKEDKLNNAFAVAFGSDGTIWTCERGSGRVLHIGADLKLIKAFKASEPNLTGIGVDSKGKVWLSTQGPKMHVYDAAGAKEREFMGAPKAALAAAYRFSFDDKDNLYVLDSARGNNQDPDVKIFAADGSKVANFMAKGAPFTEFSCIGVDPQGVVAVNNLGSNPMDSQGILLFDMKGKLKGRASGASSNVSLRSCSGLAIGLKGDWALDLTPISRGCDRFTLPPLE